MDISYIHLYLKFHANPAKSFTSREFKRKMKYQLTQLAQVKDKLINKQNIILMLWILISYK